MKSRKRIPGLQAPIPNPIPAWALADDTPYPCPCGRPMEEDMIGYKGEEGLLQIFHSECFAFYNNLKEDDD